MDFTPDISSLVHIIFLNALVCNDMYIFYAGSVGQGKSNDVRFRFSHAYGTNGAALRLKYLKYGRQAHR